MSIPAGLNQLAGSWQGMQRLWLMPTDPVRESHSEMVISPTANGNFLLLRYTWAEDGQVQEGLLVAGSAENSSRVRAAWVDSWHMQHEMMICEGEEKPGGGFSVRGAYPPPYASDWGWRITITPQEPDTFLLTMHNIPPDGQELLAVETVYLRQP